MLIFSYKITNYKKPSIFLYLLILLVFNTSLTALENSRTLQYLNSLEYKMLCNQIYSTARYNFNQLNLDNVKTTMLEQKNSENLPLAIITDIDETILLNYEFQKMLFTTKHKFSYKLFEKYINMKTAIPIHGSLKYYKYLASKGIKILYVSNRKHSTVTKTYEHLKELG